MTNRRLLILCTVLLPSVSALGMTMRAQSASSGGEPVTLSRDWRRLQVPGMLVIGNAHDGDLKRTAEEILRFRLAIHQLSPKLRMDSPIPMVVVVFRDDQALTRFKPRSKGKPIDHVAAYFSSLPDINYIVLAPSDNRDFTYRVIFHEYTHFLVENSTPRLPRWLDEGIAEFFSTFNGSEHDGRTFIGRVIPEHHMLLQTSRLVPLEEFIDPSALARMLRDEPSTQRFYAQSWALTHYLILGEKAAYQPKLRLFMDAMQSGEAEEQAFARTVNSDLVALDRGFRNYIYSAALPAARLPNVTLKIDEKIEPLAEADAQQVQADLLVRFGAFEEAEKHLTKALALDAKHIGARLSRARQLAAQNRFDDALDLLRAPDLDVAEDFPVTFLKAEVLRAAERFQESIPISQAAVSKRPDSAPAYFGLSLSQLALKRAADATASFYRCLALRPDPSWYYARLQATQRIGLDTFAVIDAANYVRQAGWQDAASPYAMYIAALTSMRDKNADQVIKILNDIAANVDPRSWQATIVEYLGGRLSADAFLKKASPEDLLTEAHAYIGIKAHIDGDQATALQHLQWVKEKGRRDYTEYGLALAELDRIEHEP
jgi:tetratricopeptide (TPR) repeat protein